MVLHDRDPDPTKDPAAPAVLAAFDAAQDAGMPSLDCYRAGVKASSCVMSSLAPHDAALWFVQLGNYDELTIPEAPYIGIVMPDELMRHVTEAALAERRSPGGWVLNRVRKHWEQSRALVGKIWRRILARGAVGCDFGRPRAATECRFPAAKRTSATRPRSTPFAPITAIGPASIEQVKSTQSGRSPALLDHLVGAHQE